MVLVGVASFVVAWGLAIEADPQVSPVFFVVDVALGVIAVLAVVLRHRAPLVAALVVAAVSGFSVLALGAFLLSVVSLATRRRALEIVSVVVVTVISSVLAATLGVPPQDLDVPVWQVVVLASAVTLALALVGVFIGARRELFQSLRREAEAARREQSMAAEQARTAERERIARELHDELGHRLSLIALHSGALEYREDLPPPVVREAAGVMRESAHEALKDLRSTLGLLRERPGTAESHEPSPGVLERMSELVADAEGAGTPVSMRVDPCIGDLRGVAGRHIYRMVQEALTNATRHAPGQPVELEICGVPGQALQLKVRNPLPERVHSTTAGGYGLIGIDERARLSGGGMNATVDDSGCFVLQVWMPWPT